MRIPLLVAATVTRLGMKMKSFVAVVPLIAVGACASGSTAGGESGNTDARDYALEQISDYCSTADYGGPDTLAGYLKKDSFNVLVGHIGEVKTDRAYVLPENAGGTPDDPGVEVNVNEDEWDWAFVRASVTGEGVGTDSEISIAVYPSADLDRFLRGVTALGDIVVVTQTRSDAGPQVPAYCYKLIGLVGTDGGVSFPALGEAERAFVDGVDTVDEIRDLSSHS